MKQLFLDSEYRAPIILKGHRRQRINSRVFNLSNPNSGIISKEKFILIDSVDSRVY